ncbi:BURP domain-containing protein 4-like [Miscanthus floridulus]|uniref:BURP domain-containing protein 4-like n=1 Tax=Miscanthus floridulus TaxID=154761 RepID=UPI00345A58E9
MGCRALALLLLTLAVAVALPSSAAGGRGAKTGSSTEAISIQDIDAVFFPSPAQDQEVDPTGTKSTGRRTLPGTRWPPNGVARIGKAGGAMVPCHLMAYPYMVHYCHRLAADVEALRVKLMGLGDDGHAAAAAASGATAIAMCHANTTTWDARYFQMLNATRGEEICHFMPRNYVLWLPAAAL